MKTKTVKSYDDLAFIYCKMGINSENLFYLNQALRTWSQLEEQFPDNPCFKERTDYAKQVIQKFFPK